MLVTVKYGENPLIAIDERLAHNKAKVTGEKEDKI